MDHSVYNAMLFTFILPKAVHKHFFYHNNNYNNNNVLVSQNDVCTPTPP